MNPALIALLCGLAPIAAIACACAITSAEVRPDPTPCIHPDDQADTRLRARQAAQEATLESWWTT